MRVSTAVVAAAALLCAPATAQLLPDGQTPEDVFKTLQIPIPPQWIPSYTRCVFNQTAEMAAVSAMRPLQWHVGPQAGEPGKYNINYVSSVAALNLTTFRQAAPTGSSGSCRAVGGKFCYVGTVIPNFPYKTTACVPQSCSEDDFKIAAAATLAGEIPLFPDPTVIVATGCEANMKEKYRNDDAAQSYAAWLISLLVLGLVATALCRVVEVIEQLKAAPASVGETTALLVSEDEKKVATAEEKPRLLPAFVMDFLKCFDLSESLDRLLMISPASRGTNFLNGMRVFSICWVMLGHTPDFVNGEAPGFQDMGEVYGYFKQFRMVLVASGLYAVDTFFFMSGFLACYLFLGKKARRAWDETFNGLQAARNLGLTWLGRYARLTPLYAIVLYSNYYLLEYMMDSPFANTFARGGQFGGEACRKYAYLNFLYVQNLFAHNHTGDDSKMYCFGHSWYLANDFQFLIVGSFLMVGYIYRPKISLAVTGVAMIITLSLDIAFMSDTANTLNMGMFNYNKPYIRAPPYLYGLICGYVLAVHGAKVKEFVAKPLARWALYVGSFVVMSGCIVLVWAAFRQQLFRPATGQTPAPGAEQPWDLPKARAYQFAYHFGWGLALFALACVWSNGHGGIINRFLSCPVFEPLGKLSFGVYLIHPIVQQLVVAGIAQGNTVEYTDIWLMSIWVASSFGSFLASFVTFLFIERPFAGLYTWLLAAAMGKYRAPKPKPACTVVPEAREEGNARAEQL